MQQRAPSGPQLVQPPVPPLPALLQDQRLPLHEQMAPLGPAQLTPFVQQNAPFGPQPTLLQPPLPPGPTPPTAPVPPGPLPLKPAVAPLPLAPLPREPPVAPPLPPLIVVTLPPHALATTSEAPAIQTQALRSDMSGW